MSTVLPRLLPSRPYISAGTLVIDVISPDKEIAARLPGFNGMERAFALVPSEQNGNVRWDRVNLGYDGASYSEYRQTGESQGSPIMEPVLSSYQYDWHRSLLGPGAFDEGAVKKYGIAVGLETNVGIVWGQEFQQNAIPR
jgi:hypothetical protein